MCVLPWMFSSLFLWSVPRNYFWPQKAKSSTQLATVSISLSCYLNKALSYKLTVSTNCNIIFLMFSYQNQGASINTFFKMSGQSFKYTPGSGRWNNSLARGSPCRNAAFVSINCSSLDIKGVVSKTKYYHL